VPIDQIAVLVSADCLGQSAPGGIAEVDRGAAETGAAAEQVHGFARSLLNESNHLTAEVGKLLATVRAA